ncbi:MAG TPA: hypothetical protein PKN92_03165 [Candidatus Hydrogenedentes bacterium]|nr:MAG: hypothetical protein BWY07_00098 [Candidatus Hydrogenedentes bacterium ADurb.Bin170]HNZ47824.1 hypothetical protein [Candidatus Hydrogenedentota bacterium]HOD94123.1 hypothetical protein [Candidatus Hydrogenedentota bacterium]HOM48211.1 hypothetical protein [Candidatus Hydrogenedentota bacterium]HPX85065.1 hypothetical protein [Candidatus Hydrogenedentota bacterium]
MHALFLALAVYTAAVLPAETGPEALAFTHFPDRLHAFVWRNWNLVPLERMAAAVGTDASQILETGRSMGLPHPPDISKEQSARSYITIIRANWHLLPFDQLLTLLEWDAEKLAYTLREDDFLLIKLGGFKPVCAPLQYHAPDASVKLRVEEIKDLVHQYFGEEAGSWKTPPFSFIKDLCEPVTHSEPVEAINRFNPRFCYSYFALYGDPFLEQDPFPDGYLQRLAESGVNGVWLHAVLYKLSPFPWAPELSEGWEQRLESLRAMTERAARFGIGIYLYFNEPRAMPLAFFEKYPDLKGVEENGYATLCTARPEVASYITDATASIASAAPALAGILTITASENLTNCWSHHRGDMCSRCAERGAAKTIADVNTFIASGLDRAGSNARLLAWDWGWAEPWAQECVALLPRRASLMSVSEWDAPVSVGGVSTKVGEYSLSVVGPGPRALRQWEAAKNAGLGAVAKIQANTTWELGALPYIPAVANVAEHITHLRESGVSGLMLGWTLGGYPSPNLEVVYALGEPLADGRFRTADEALHSVAEKRFGSDAAGTMVHAWKKLSDAFKEFPYHGGVVYNAPLQVGPANLLWREPTGYKATMVGLPYDDLDAWRVVYPAGTFLDQLEKVASGFRESALLMESALEKGNVHATAVQQEMHLAQAAALHYQSIAQQGRFILQRNELAKEANKEKQQKIREEMKELLRQELECARSLYELQRYDSRIGFEATNHYFYTPADLVEKVLNCARLMESL